MKNRFVKLVIITGILVLLCSCGKIKDLNFSSTTEGYNYQTTSTTAPYVYQTQQAEVSYYTEIPPTSYTTFVADTVSETQQTTSITVTDQSPTDIPTQSVIQESTTENAYEKTGEMAFSDSADNKYIKAVTTKYGVNAKNLAALYTVPDNDGNIVLEFDGTTDANGKLIRNKDTLISIYSVDKNLTCKRASETLSLNEYSYGEMKVMFFSTTKYIMPEFEAELNG